MTVHVEDAGPEGAVRVVRLDRPERRNALDRDTLDALVASVVDAPAAVDGGSTRVLVLRGTGGHFCAGADLTGVEDDGFVAALREVLVALHRSPFPTVAALEGAVLGAGLQLAVACDLRAATANASIGVPAGKLGLMVDGWTVARAVAVAGDAVARQLLVAGDVLTGARAHELGLVQHLGDADEALAWAERIAALAPLTLAGHKIGINGVGAGDEGRYDDAFRRAWASSDLQEGLAAFRERRAPRFTGT